MDQEDQHSPESADISPAIPLEISAELAAGVDEILQDFAEGAELETALVVERSGALVSGISSEAEVMVEIISALVAGASAAMNALVRELGSTGNIESFHQSEERAVYLAEVMDRFILVGVSTVPVPVGVIREKARRIRPALIDLLQEIKVAPVPATVDEKRTFSLREMALTRAAERPPGIHGESEAQAAGAEAPPAATDGDTDTEEIFFEAGDEEPEPELVADEAGPEELVLDDDEVDTVFEAIDDDEPEEEPEPALEESEPGEPTGVIEYLDDDSPEIVIEDSSGGVIDSPFETEDDDDFIDGAETPSESIFELEDEGESEIEELNPGGVAVPDEEEAPVFEIEAEEPEEEEAVFEIDEPESAEPVPPVVEIEEENDDGEEGDEETFELDFDDFEEDDDEETRESANDEIEAEESEEKEASSSGPFYF